MVGNIINNIQKLFHVIKSVEESIILQLCWESDFGLGTFVKIC